MAYRVSKSVRVRELSVSLGSDAFNSIESLEKSSSSLSTGVTLGLGRQR
jgi:hypothetical protein